MYQESQALFWNVLFMSPFGFNASPLRMLHLHSKDLFCTLQLSQHWNVGVISFVDINRRCRFFPSIELTLCQSNSFHVPEADFLSHCFRDCSPCDYLLWNLASCFHHVCRTGKVSITGTQHTKFIECITSSPRPSVVSKHRYSQENECQNSSTAV